MQLVLPYLLLVWDKIPALSGNVGCEGRSQVGRGEVSVTTVSFADVLYWCRDESRPILCSCHSHPELHQPLGE
jgi:hypothetical protein